MIYKGLDFILVIHDDIKLNMSSTIREAFSLEKSIHTELKQIKENIKQHLR